MIEALMEYRFLQYAVAAGFFASILSGIIGVIVVEKRLVMMSGGIAHTAYGGVGLGYLLGFEPLIGAFAFAVGAGAGMGYIKRKGNLKSDVIVGLFWSLGMAAGILFVSLTPGYPPDMSSYLFGNILAVRKVDLIMIGLTALFILLVISVFFNYWKAYLFDDDFAQIRNINVALLDYLIFILVALTTVSMIRVVGIILVIALLTAPAAISAFITKNFKFRMIVSGILACVFIMSGLWLSFALDVSSGAMIVILSVTTYFISWIIHEAVKRKRKINGIRVK